MSSFKMPAVMVVAALLLTALAACSQGFSHWQDEGAQPATVVAASARHDRNGQARVDAANSYRLDSGDRLSIRVFGQPSLSGEFTIDGAGHVALPLIGNLMVRGLSTPEIEARITEKLAAKYLRNPDVTVATAAYRPFYILGQVNRAGQYPYVNGMTVQTAVAIAGGYSPRAAQKRVRVTRQTAQGARKITLNANEQILPGDTIYVKERWF